MAEHERIRWLDDLTKDDVAEVGGKNASLGEMIGTLQEEGIRVPSGFATTAAAYREFLEENELSEKLKSEIEKLESEQQSIAKTGERIRQLYCDSTFPEELSEAIRTAYRELSKRTKARGPSVAVRSSATAEDLPEASFAGQLETFLNGPMNRDRRRAPNASPRRRDRVQLRAR